MEISEFGKPFWGKCAQMGVRMLDDRVLERDSIELPTQPIPLFRGEHPDEGGAPGDIIGRIEHVWYGDESGLQVIYFDGHFLKKHEDYLSEYPRHRQPAMTADRVEAPAMLITHARLQSVTLVEFGAWMGSGSTFIFDSPLPEMLSKRGRM